MFRLYRGHLVIIISFLLAFVLSVLPLGETYRYFNPEWVSLVLIFWCIYLPKQFGIFTAWLIGLFMDILMGVLLGQYALVFALIAFMSIKLRNRLNIYPHLHQTLIIMLIIAVSLMIILWIKGIQHETPDTFLFWLPAITSAIVWPFLSVILNKIRLIYGVIEK